MKRILLKLELGFIDKKVKYLIQALVNTCDLEDEVLVPVQTEFNNYFKQEYKESTGLEFIKDEEGSLRGVAVY